MAELRYWPLLDEFRIFYAVDRELYTVLVRDLSRNSSEALHIMGLWLCFERGCFDVISKVLALSPKIINCLADEAVECLHVFKIEVPYYPQPIQSPLKPLKVPLTRTLLGNNVVEHYFRENQITIFHELSRLISDVIIPALSDLMERARDGGFRLGPSWAQPEDSLAQNLSRLSFDKDMSPCLENEMSGFARTMYAIFTQGEAVSETEMRQFFNMLLGKCIELVHVHEVEPGEEPVYARIRFLRPTFVQIILNGETMARLAVNGKTVWMRQYMPRMGWMLCGCPTVGPSKCCHRK